MNMFFSFLLTGTAAVRVFSAKIVQMNAMQVYLQIAECSLSYDAKEAQKNEIAASSASLLIFFVTSSLSVCAARGVPNGKGRWMAAFSGYFCFAHAVSSGQRPA